MHYQPGGAEGEVSSKLLNWQMGGQWGLLLREQGSQFEARWWVHFDGLRCLGASDIGGSLAGVEEPRLGIQRGSGQETDRWSLSRERNWDGLRGVCRQEKEEQARQDRHE